MAYPCATSKRYTPGTKLRSYRARYAFQRGCGNTGCCVLEKTGSQRELTSLDVCVYGNAHFVVGDEIAHAHIAVLLRRKYEDRVLPKATG
jgi:hypothetical protein